MAEQLKVSGTVIAILEAKTGTGQKGDWKSQSFVIETAGQYPKKTCISCFNAMADDIPPIGTECTVAINIESREYNGNWYNDIKAWSISTGSAKPKAQQSSDFNPNPPASQDSPF